jgi:hypothetical protein
MESGKAWLFMESLFWTPDLQFRWEAVSSLVALFGACVLLYQLRSVAHQIKLQTEQLVLQGKQLKLQHFTDYTKRYHTIVLNFPQDVSDRKFRLTKRRKDYVQTVKYMGEYFDLTLEQWDLHRRELIDKETWAVWDGLIRIALSKPAFQQAWAILLATHTDYSAEFQQFIRDTIAQAK